jgi:hypothetical protein
VAIGKMKMYIFGENTWNSGDPSVGKMFLLTKLNTVAIFVVILLAGY